MTAGALLCPPLRAIGSALTEVDPLAIWEIVRNSRGHSPSGDTWRTLRHLSRRWLSRSVLGQDCPVEPADVAEAKRVLREVIAGVERGELDAPPLILARLSGALDALDAITDRRTVDETKSA